MKISNLVTLVVLALGASGLPASESEITGEPVLQKRIKGKIQNKDYLKAQKEKAAQYETSSSKLPDKWVRTVTLASSTKVELVRPTVIAGVTFSAKPPVTTDGLEPWISLDKSGRPKTVKPKNKDGRIESPSPTYGTWFATATTVYLNKEDLKAENMADDETFEDVRYIEEDNPDISLNPLIRCTPDYYFKKGVGKDISSEPFCTPKDNAVLYVDWTYFVTWYTRFHDKAEKVKLLLSYVKEHPMQKGTKRSEGAEIIEEPGLQNTANITKRSSVIEGGGRIADLPFFESDWIDSKQGYFPLSIEKDWIREEWYQKVLVSILPDNVKLEDFNFYENSIVVHMQHKPTVGKEHLTDLKALEERYKKKQLNYEIEEGPPFEKYMTMMAVPTCVILFALGMLLFVRINKKYVDLSHLKKPKARGVNTTHRRIPFKSKKNGYSTLPLYNSDVEPKAD